MTKLKKTTGLKKEKKSKTKANTDTLMTSTVGLTKKGCVDRSNKSKKPKSQLNVPDASNMPLRSSRKKAEEDKAQEMSTSVAAVDVLNSFDLYDSLEKAGEVVAPVTTYFQDTWCTPLAETMNDAIEREEMRRAAIEASDNDKGPTNNDSEITSVKVDSKKQGTIAPPPALTTWREKYAHKKVKTGS